MIISNLVLGYLIQHCKREIGIIEILKRLSSLKVFLNVQSMKLVSGIENMLVHQSTRVIYAVSIQKDVQKRVLKINAHFVHLTFNLIANII